MKKIAIAVCLLVFVAENTQASVRENQFGAGAIISSLSGAGMAFVSGPESTHINPANLSLCKKSSAKAGLRHISTHLNVDVTSGAPRDVRQLGSMFAFEVGGCLVPFESLGLGVWSSSNALDPMSIGITTPNTDFTFVRLDRSLTAPTLIAGLGYAFVPEIAIGFAVSVAMQAFITQDVYAPLTDNGSTFSTKISASIKPKAAIIAGLSFVPWDFVGLSTTFRTENSGKLEIPAKTQAAMGIPIPPIKVFLSSLFNYAPKQFSIGTFAKPWNFLTVAADLDYVLWSEFSTPFFEVTADETSSVSSGIPLPAQEPFQFRNIFVPKAGLEAILGENFALRAGYRFHPTVLYANPEHAANLIDQDTHSVSLGGGYKIDKGGLEFNIDLFAAIHFMPNQTMQKAASQSALAYNYGGVLVSAGATTGVAF